MNRINHAADYLARLATLEADATPGPWEADADAGAPGIFAAGASWALLIRSPRCVGTPADMELAAEARTALPHLLAALEAVRQIHTGYDALNVRYNIVQKVCEGCGTDDGNYQLWPCPTIRAINRALEVTP